MPRDYKHRVVRRRKRHPASPWLGMIAGLLIGLFAAATAYFKLFAPPTPGPQAPAFMPESPAPPEKPAPPKEAKPQEKTAVAAAPKPRFDFYTILPEMQVVIPEEELGASTAPAAIRPLEKPAEKTVAKAAEKPMPPPATLLPVEPSVKPAPPFKPPSKGNYFLQTDSFRNADEANRFKAEIATLGFEASVQKLTIGKTLYHRVRVGPFADFGTLDRARALLRQHGIPSTPLMIHP